MQNEKKMREVSSKYHTIGECLKELGLRAAGGNYKAFKAACNKLDIPIPDYKLNFEKRSKATTKYSLSEILVENSAYTNTTNLKNRLIREGLLQEICYECSQRPTWNGQRLVLQLDHINGAFNDHRINNLRLLCPNCHSQTVNFAGKNSKRKNKKIKCCFDCKAEISKTASRCLSCSSESRKKFKASKEELQHMIENMSFRAIARNFGVSDNAVRKRAKKLGIKWS